jgi:hypothetical protein
MMQRERGSVLIEAMVASTIVALMLAAMYSSIADSSMRSQLVAEKRMALMIAQSEMDSVGSILPLAPGTSGGVEGQYSWRVDIAPYPTPQGASGAGPLYQVTVSIRASDRTAALVTLRTLALGPVS